MKSKQGIILLCEKVNTGPYPGSPPTMFSCSLAVSCRAKATHQPLPHPCNRNGIFEVVTMYY